MGRVSKIKMDAKVRKRVINHFFEVLDELPDNERRFFLICLLTHTELDMLAKRLAVLERVAQEEKSYGEIKEELKVNQSTIARLRNSLHHFGEPFCNLILKLRRV